MTSAEAGAAAPDSTPETTAAYRITLLVIVVLASTLYATTVLVVSVILPQMQGSLSATQDQISWVVTLNILATAMVTPMTGWLVARFGRRSVMLWGLGGFTLATLLCGTATSLEELVLWRVAQGALGAPLTPLAQAVILDTFPKRQHGTVTSIFGMGVVVGPVIGPIMGGYLAEAYNWRWAFFMIFPVGVVSWIGLAFILRDAGRSQSARLDWTGFLSLIVAVAGFQLMLDRGERADWFDSMEIVAWAAIAALSIYVFVVHSLMADRPFLNLRLLLDRNYALGLVIVTVYGMLNFTPMVMMPPMLQNLMGYPDAIIGELLAWRGAGAVLGFFLAMYVGKLDPRIGMSVGFLMLAGSGVLMMNFDTNVTPHDVAVVSATQGVAIGLIWVPLVIATYATLDPRHLAETSSVFHLMRNLGSSLFISLSVTTVVRSGNANYQRMTEFASPYHEPIARGIADDRWSLETIDGLARFAREIHRQAAMIAYLNAFALFTLACLAALPLILLVRVRRAPPAPPAPARPPPAAARAARPPEQEAEAT
ncbi:DHA2 family multidrug resistance protein [Constrictibacter sp. MBR-5]|jgi:DHA2 family multidrug resistance protein|uniref:DHA2 family efflux MFS transporter permease subunit n=1 Tax=Constrictibacter sp. MBR-5 TaxID=3156467 RepID=UPI00339492E2